MGLAVFISPPVSLLVTRGVGFLGALDCLFRLCGLDLPLELVYKFFHCLHGSVLGGPVVGLLGHFSCKVFIGVSEVSHCRPVF